MVFPCMCGCVDLPPERQTAHARDDDLTGFYGHLKTISVEGKRARSSQFIKDEGGKLFNGVKLIHE